MAICVLWGLLPGFTRTKPLYTDPQQRTGDSAEKIAPAAVAMNPGRFKPSMDPAVKASVSGGGAAADLPRPPFSESFSDGALRLEFSWLGSVAGGTVSLQQVYAEPIWPEHPGLVIPDDNYGRTQLLVFDAATQMLICRRRFDALFGEYLTTTPAREGIARGYEFTVRIPQPRQPVRVVLEQRDGHHRWTSLFERELDPGDRGIRRESGEQGDVVFELRSAGAPADSVDLAFLSEGYRADEEAEFRADVTRLSEYLFSQAPYGELRDHFSIRGVFRPSAESGVDEPGKGIFRNTVLNSSFSIFDLDRYLLVEDNHRMHRMAAQVPCDCLVVLVNSKTYGGGAIGFDSCVTTTGHPMSPLVFVHEFGHAFAYLADEYTGDVAYNDMYPEGIEPVEPNITRELDPGKLKWRSHLTPGVILPTPVLPVREAVERQIVGAFEGGGYVERGMYRPEQECWMGSLRKDEGFCVVCRAAIRRMVLLHCGR
ncbi:MAG: M64 family metallopeptidase [Planctomycetota bacterium]